MFEYAPSSSALAVLTRQPVESAAVQGLLAHGEEQDDSNEFIDIDAFDDEALIDPQLRSTTQLGISRIEESSNTYCPSTLPPRLHQTNPFSQGIDDEEARTHELTPYEVAPTAEELQAAIDEEDDDQALSEAMETFLRTTRTGRTIKASLKVVENHEVAKEVSRRGGRRGGRDRGRGIVQG
jgi:hypothetical protein